MKNILVFKTTSDKHFLQLLNFINQEEKTASLHLVIHSETYDALQEALCLYAFNTVYLYTFPRIHSFEKEKLRSSCSPIFSNAYDLVVIPFNNHDGAGYEKIFPVLKDIKTKGYLFYSIGKRIIRCRSIAALMWKRSFQNAAIFRLFDDLKPILFHPNRVKELQMPVIQACNSRCVMCNMWKNNVAESITAKNFANILSNKLFRDVEVVGLNGGEPTLRQDLLELIRVLPEKLPKLKGVNVITNGICNEHILGLVKKIHSYFQAKGIRFHVYVSIDGIGSVHDCNRGVEGNFDSAVALIDSLKKENISVSIGCTLTKINLYAADDVLRFAEEKNMSARVRLGVDIARLFNDGFFASQRYDENEIFHLTQFFQSRHELTGDISYYSLFRQLAYKSPRLAGCSWRHAGVTLDGHGNLSYCSVASPILGNCLVDSAAELYAKNIKKRKAILKNHCQFCMHDLQGPLRFKDWLTYKKERKVHSRANAHLQARLKVNRMYQKIKKRQPCLSEAKRIIITGWWGTETHGDKAILGELFYFLKEKCSFLESVSLTHTPDMEYVVRKTLAELEETGLVSLDCEISLFPIVDMAKSKQFSKSDFLIVGGGPLQRIPFLTFIEEAFVSAVAKGKGTMLFGCGIHPEWREYEDVLISILRCTQYGFFRDEESLKFAYKLLGGDNACFSVCCDPAISFVKRWVEKNGSGCKKYEVCTLLRDNTAEFMVDDSQQEIKESNQNVVNAVSALLSKVDKSSVLLAMHHLWMGGDDRLINRKIFEQIARKEKVNTTNFSVMSLDTILREIASSRIALCARYHGHLFAFALGIPFLSFDYSGEKNKVANFMRKVNKKRFSIQWNRVGARTIEERFNELIAAYDRIQYDYNQIKDELLRTLYEYYETVD